MAAKKTFGTLWVVACAVGCGAGLALGGLPGCVVGLALVIIGSLWSIIELRHLRATKLTRRFRRDFNGRWLLVCSRRGQWGQFIDNNVLTVLPDGVQVVWCDRRSKDTYPASALRLMGLGNVVERPYLVRYESRQPEIYRLHERLVELSHTTKRDEYVSSLVRSVLREFVEGPDNPSHPLAAS